MRYHANDVILSPDQVPMEGLDYTYLNDPAKVIVRQLFVAKAKQTLGLVRGKFSGKVSIPQAEMSMDYQMLIQQGKEEYDAAMDKASDEIETLRAVLYAVGFKKGSELTEKENGAIKELAADGTLAELAEKYGLSNYLITEYN